AATLSSPWAGATIDYLTLSGSTADWDVILEGAQFDPGNDQQAQSNAGADLVGSATDATLYTIYDDNGTPFDTDDEVAFRIRVGGSKSGSFSTFIWMGVDLDLDGDVDAFITIDGNGKTGAQFAGDVQVYSAGTGQNTSPSTSDASNPSVAVALVDGTNFSFDQVSDTIDPGTTLDINGDAENDWFISYKVSWTDLKNHLEYDDTTPTPVARPLTDSILGPDTGNITDLSLSKDTSIAFTLSTSTQGNNTNSDVGGYDDKLDDLTVTYEDQGAFSPPLSFSNINPVITSDGGGDTAALAVDEQSGTTATDVDATDANGDALTFSIVSAVDEPVNSVDAGDFSIDSSTGVLSFVSEPNFDTPTDSDTNNVYLVVVKVTDARGAEDTQALTITVNDIVGDTTPPDVAITGVPAITNSAFTATFQFTEVVTGFVEGDISVTNATLSNFTAVDGDTYTVLVTPSADGAFTVDVAAAVAQDGAGNDNTAATQVAGTYDATAPTVSITGVPAITNTSFTATVQFSENVTGFDVTDISTSNAGLSAFTAVDGDTYTVLVSPVTDGAFTLDVAAAVATDAAGNSNTAATQAAGAYDTASPSVAISGVPVATNLPFTATVQFSEVVAGFVVGDIGVSNATLSDFVAVDGDTYTVLVTPVAEGTFTLDVAASVAVDAAGNANTAASQGSGTYDTTAPTVAIQNVPAATNAAFTATIQFSETVTGFDVTDIAVSNVTLSGFNAVDGDTFTVLVTPTADGAFTL
ncbi:MAG: Ig-like domain-containing protein, partial [Alcanivoracaceae bacterium]